MSNIEQLEISKQEALDAVALRDALLRLQNTADYKLVFEKELFQDFAAQCVLALGAPNTQSETAQAAIKRDIAMLGALYSRLYSIVSLGHDAAASLEPINDEIDLERGEDL